MAVVEGDTVVVGPYYSLNKKNMFPLEYEDGKQQIIGLRAIPTCINVYVWVYMAIYCYI